MDAGGKSTSRDEDVYLSEKFDKFDKERVSRELQRNYANGIELRNPASCAH